MLQRASIYDAAKSDAEDQLMFYFGDGDRNSQMREIGVAQGLCELCESFENNPVRWVKTVNETLVLQKLEENDMFPKGVWIFVACTATSVPILTAEVRDAYRQFRLLQGSFRHCVSNKISFRRWWHDFCESWEADTSFKPLKHSGYLRLDSGVLSPDVGTRLAEIGAGVDAVDVAVYNNELGCIFPGYHFEADVHADVQAVLQTWLGAGPVQDAKVEEPPAEPSQEPQGDSWLSAYMPSMSIPTSMSMPSIPSMSMPIMSLPSMPSFQMPEFSWLGSSHSPEARAPQPVRQTVLIEDEQYQVLAVPNRDLLYTFVSREETTVASETLDSLSRDITGISFARDPPTDFEYMVLDHERRTVTTTLTPTTEPELVAAMISGEPSSTLCRARWFRHCYMGTLEIVLCRQAREMDWGLRDQDEWVKGFARRRGYRNIY